jgi:hypothetical protein
MMILALADNTVLFNLHPSASILPPGLPVQKTKADAAVLSR